MTAKVNGLLLCWHFYEYHRQLKPIKKLMMKLTTNPQRNSLCPILVDKCSTDDFSSVSQHSSKPNVVRSVLSVA